MAPSALAQKVPAIILTTLPLLLLTPGFILTVYASYSRDWTWRKEYDEDVAFKGISYRGPFVTCNIAANNKCSPVRTRVPGGLCKGDATSQPDSIGFCRQLILGSQLLYAGDALLGAALLLVLILTASTLPAVMKSQTGVYVPRLFGRLYNPLPTSDVEAGYGHAHRHVHHHGRQSTIATSIRAANHTVPAYLTLLTMLLSALSALLLLMGMFITVNDLVNLQYPSGDWYTTGNPSSIDIVRMDLVGQWLIGKAPGQAAAGAMLAGLATVAVALVWETPRVGIGRDVEHHSTLEASASQGRGMVERDIAVIPKVTYHE